jgi:hypothetical protein
VSGRGGAAGRRFLLPGGAAPAGAARGPDAAADGEPRGAAAPRRLTMLTRGWCHLCDDMREALAPIVAARTLDLVLVDVDADAVLEAAYGERVPVLFAGDLAGGREICHARLDRDALAAALAGEPEIR